MPKPTTKSPPPPDVLKESAALAKTFLAALKEYKDSPAIRKAVEDAVAGLREAGRELADALEKTRHAPANARLESTVKKAVTGGRAKAEKSLHKYRSALADGLVNLSLHIDRLAVRIKTRKG